MFFTDRILIPGNVLNSCISSAFIVANYRFVSYHTLIFGLVKNFFGQKICRGTKKDVCDVVQKCLVHLFNQNRICNYLIFYAHGDIAVYIRYSKFSCVGLSTLHRRYNMVINTYNIYYKYLYYLLPLHYKLIIQKEYLLE